MTTTLVGNIVKDPEMRYTNNGKAVASFSVAVSKKRGDEEYTSYFDCSAWSPLAENVVDTLRKGDRVVLFGALTQDRFEKDGQKRSAVTLTVDAIGPELRFAKATIHKIPKGEGPAPHVDTAPF